MDLALTLLLPTSFALLATVHVSLCFALGSRLKWWRGVAALVLFPLAPLWGIDQKLRVLVALWLTALMIYASALIAALAL